MYSNRIDMISKWDCGFIVSLMMINMYWYIYLQISVNKMHIVNILQGLHLKYF